MNGTTMEGVSIIFQTIFGLGAGIFLGFYIEWRLALVGLLTLPIIMAAAFVTSKITEGISEYDEIAHKNAESISGEAITNARTVATLGHEETLINQYIRYLNIPLRRSSKRFHLIGIIYGVTTCLETILYQSLYYIGSYFIYKYGITGT